MLTFREKIARETIVAVLIAANVLLYCLWPWLRTLPFDADTTDQFVRKASFRQEQLLKNEAYLSSFFDEMQVKKRILFFGTSESVTSYDLASQLNSLALDNPQMVRIAQGGLSPIHSCLVFAKCARGNIRIPPTVLVINLTYFEMAHDTIDDGYISAIMRTPIFLLMNHRDINSYLGDDVLKAYDRHFAFICVLYPVMMQRYLGTLLYLLFHQAASDALRFKHLPDSFYRFNNTLPEYDVKRSVHVGYRASDQMAKNRWLVNTVDNSVNLKGIASIMTILSKQPAPVLFLILPTNRTFYEYNGLDMREYDRRYADIRRRIRALVTSKNSYLIDLYENPKLHLGFEDRMHADEYGFFQLASHLVKSEEYIRFIEAVRRYYSIAHCKKEINFRK